MQLPAWFSAPKKANKPPTSAEIAAKLAEAENDLRAAGERVEAARDRLAAERSDAAREALRAAKLEVDDVTEMLAILRGDQAAAAARDAEAERARLSAEADGLEDELNASVPDAEGERLLAAEVDAWRVLVEIRIARTEHQTARERRLEIYRRLCAQLDRSPVATRNGVGLIPPVREALKNLAQQAGQGPRRDLIANIAQAVG